MMIKRKSHTGTGVILLLLSIISPCLFAVNGNLGGGFGSEEDPYLIEDATDFMSITYDMTKWSRHIKLTVDLDLSSSPFYQAPLAWDGAAHPFSGHFDGGNHTISGLSIRDLEKDGNTLALFGILAEEALVENLTLDSPSIIDGIAWIGGLCGFNQGGTISNCAITGNGTIEGQNYVGGICGRNGGFIEDCYSNATVTGLSGGQFIGGLAGYNTGTIRTSTAAGSISGDISVGGFIGYNMGSIAQCRSLASVNGKSSDTGGFCGINISGSMEECEAFGNVSSSTGLLYNAGGFVGKHESGTIANCYAQGDVTANSNAGGFVGNQTGTLENCYSTGSSSQEAGGFCGLDNAATTVSCFWDTETSGNLTSKSGVGKTTAELQMASTFTGWDFVTTSYTDETWIMGSYPRLTYSADIVDVTYDAGSEGTITEASGGSTYVLSLLAGSPPPVGQVHVDPAVGYAFAGWSPQQPQMLIQSLTLTATYMEIPVPELRGTWTDAVPVENNNLGQALVLYKHTVLAGAPGDDTVADGAGAVQAIATSGSFQDKMTGSQSDAGAGYGSAIAVEGKYTVIGAPYEGVGGAAYVIDRTTDEELYRLTLSSPANGDTYGMAVATDGRYALVGCPGREGAMDNNTGAGYVYDLQTGQLLRKLEARDSVSANYMGLSAAISGNYAILGSSDTNVIGAVYVFDITTGTQLYKLTLANSGLAYHHGTYFGRTLAVSGKWLAIGASWYNTPERQAGSVFVYDLETGLFSHELTRSDKAAYDYFGQGLAARDGLILVGAPGDDDQGNSSGSVYFYDLATGDLWAKLTAPDGTEGDEFGTALSIYGNNAVIGAPYKTVNATAGAGSIYYYFLDVGHDVLLHPGDHGSIAEANDAGSVNWSGVFNGVDLTISVNVSPSTGFDFAGWTPPLARRLSSDVETTAQYIPVTKITAGAGVSANENFGSSVALVGDYALIGSPNDQRSGSYTGGVFVYNRQSRAIIGQLTDQNTANDRFGFSVDAVDNYAVVGATLSTDHGTSSGSAYLFNYTNQQQIHKLLPDDGSANDQFGWAVAVNSGRIFVSAPFDPNSDNSGSVYVFDRALGTQIYKIQPAGNRAANHYGYALDVADDLLLVGAPESGNAFIHDTMSTTLLQVLSSSNSSSDSRFGDAVALSGSYAVIGEYANGQNGELSGCAYIFDVATGEELHRLQPGDLAAGDRFGDAVSAFNNLAVIGAPGREGQGAYFVYDLVTGDLLMEISSQYVSEDDSFASAVSIYESTVLTGAAYDDSGAPNAGAAYLHKLGEDCTIVLHPGDHGNFDSVAAGEDFTATVTYGTALDTVLDPITGDLGFMASAWTPELPATVVSNLEATARYALATKIFPENPGDNPGFEQYDVGASVAVSGEYAIVGAPGHSYYYYNFREDVGAAYVYDATTRELLGKLEPPVLYSEGNFGGTVLIEGDKAIVSAAITSRYDTSLKKPCAYIYALPSLELVDTLIPSDASFEAIYASHLAVHDGYLVLGSYGDDTNGTKAGAAYIFDLDSGLERNKLLPSDGATEDYFGYRVAINADIVAVAAPWDDDEFNQSGSIYVFDRDTGEELQKMHSPEPGVSGYFGMYMDLSNDYLLVSNFNAQSTGKVYVFDGTDGSFLNTIQSWDGLVGTSFGRSITIYGHQAYIGDTRAADNGLEPGAVYLFDIEENRQLEKITAPDPLDGSYFGWDLDYDGTTLLVGAISAFGDTNLSGAAYAFNRESNPTCQVTLDPGTHGAIDQADSPGPIYSQTFNYGAAFPHITVTPESYYLHTGWDLQPPANLFTDFTAIAQYEQVDADEDGLGDWDEINVYFTQTDNEDTDGDNVSDGDEVHLYGTNPAVPDTDYDGFNDGFELSAGMDPNASNDAVSQIVYERLRNDPLEQDLQDLFTSDRVVYLQFGQVTVEVDPMYGTSELIIPVQTSQDLINWTDVPDYECPRYYDPNNYNIRFYRIQLTDPAGD